jgi:hypothetical protein
MRSRSLGFALSPASALLAVATFAAPLLAQWTLSPQPTVRIGSDASPETQFNDISHLRRLSDGRILVTTGPDIRFFDAAGRFLARAGGRGRGPGEFLHIGSLLVMPGDTLMALNFRTVVILDPEGKYVRQSQPDLAPLSSEGWATEGSMLLPNGNLLAPQYPQEQAMARPTSLYRPTVRHSILDLRSSMVTPLHVGGGWAQQFIEERPFVQAFTPHVQVAIGADRVHVGDNDSTTIHVFDLAGRRLGTWTVAERATPVTPAELAAHRQRMVEWVTMQRRSVPDFERQWAAATQPKRHPYWGSALVDAAGVLWVSGPPRTGEAPVAWTAFDRNGRRVAAVTMPARFTPKEIGEDYVLGVQRDEDGVETVAMYRLGRR